MDAEKTNLQKLLDDCNYLPNCLSVITLVTHSLNLFTKLSFYYGGIIVVYYYDYDICTQLPIASSTVYKMSLPRVWFPQLRQGHYLSAIRIKNMSFYAIGHPHYLAIALFWLRCGCANSN